MQYISIPTSAFGFDYDIELHDWHSKLQAYRVFKTKAKELLEGGLGLGFDIIHDEQCLDDWLSNIPTGYLEQTQAFPEHQYQLLWLAANSDVAAQLLITRPLLLVLICEHYTVDNQMALAVSQLGQRQILHCLGYDGAKSVLKFIDKLTLTYERNLELEHVKKQLDKHCRRYRAFNHYPSVNYVALSLDNKYPFLTGTKLGLAIASENQLGRRALRSCLSDTLALGVELGVNDPGKRVSQLSSFAELEHLHQQWINRRNDIRREKLRPVDADKPYSILVPDEANIVAIKNYDELFTEGAEQHHCIAVYHTRIVSGHYCVFTLNQPQRVTIGIKLNKQTGIIELDQIAGLRNALPTTETRELVYSWFERVKKVLKLQQGSE
ncbi:PcfJ domain-containing protein [Shewanella sp. 10N.286.51.B8]|uniref:PcfJ domain-containing protein n=1 Tax=Shewanella sp. 10N.286.51.B8 TaxID=3229708 RepID=UPI003553D5B0